MKYLIVGLGNIGSEYESTRHNIGFMVLDAFSQKLNVQFSLDRHAWKAETKWKSKTLILLKPTTYMNLSGKAVAYHMQAHQIKLEHILVICDDLAIPFASLRLKSKGSSGGQNGLQNIIETLKTDQYARLRCGIGNDFPKGKQVEYVLGKFSGDQINEIPFFLNQSIEAIENFISVGPERAMNIVNTKA